MKLINILRNIELFDGLTKEQLAQIASLCHESRLSKDDILIKQGDTGGEIYIITEGLVKVMLEDSKQTQAEVVVNLGAGQIVGEMSLIDKGLRSASVITVKDDTVVQMIQRQDLEKLCRDNTQIGYFIMRNIAADLSFKLRRLNLYDRVRI